MTTVDDHTPLQRQQALGAWFRPLARFILDLLRMAGVVAAIVVAVFFLVRVIPGDVVDAMAVEGDLSDESMQRLREAMGLTESILRQFVDWCEAALRGDLGSSLRFGRPVADMIALAIPYSLSIAGWAFLIGIVLGTLVAVLAVLRPGSLFEGLVNGLNILSIAVPSFCIGVLGIVVFSIWLGWLPSVRSIVLPSLILGVDVAGQIAKPLHEELKESAAASYVRTAHSKGLTALHVVVFHILPNSLTVVLAVSGIILANLVSGSIALEMLFGVPGIGSLAIRAVEGRDYPLVQAVMIVIAVGVVMANFLTDWLQRLVDPRTRSRS